MPLSQSEPIILAIDLRQKHAVLSSHPTKTYPCHPLDSNLENLVKFFIHLRDIFLDLVRINPLDFVIICCADAKHFQIKLNKIAIMSECLKILKPYRVKVIGNHAPLFTNWLSILKTKLAPNEIIAITRIKAVDKEGMVCGLFACIIENGQESIGKFDELSVPNNNFESLRQLLSQKYPNRVISFMAVYPPTFKTIRTMPALNFAYNEIDRALGAIMIAKAKLGIHLENYIPVREEKIDLPPILPLQLEPTTEGSRELSSYSRSQTNSQEEGSNVEMYIAIDLGTSSCKAAVFQVKDKKMDIVTFANDISDLPSFVIFTEAQTIKGEKPQSINNVQNTVCDIPYFLGKSIDNIEKYSYKPKMEKSLCGKDLLPFKVESSRSFIKFNLEITKILPEVACGELIKEITWRIERNLTAEAKAMKKDELFEIKDVILTIPVFLDKVVRKRYKKALKTAAQLASLEVRGFVETPLAVLLDWIYTYKKNIVEEFSIGVIDIGAANTSAAVYYVNQSNIEGFKVRAVKVYDTLDFGGRDIDFALANLVNQKWMKVAENKEFKKEFFVLSMIEERKMEFSRKPEKPLKFEFSDSLDTNEVSVSYQEFAILIEPMIAKLETIFKEVHISKLLLTGKTTLIPSIINAFKFNYPTVSDDNFIRRQDISPARGAIIHTSKLVKKEKDLLHYKY